MSKYSIGDNGSTKLIERGIVLKTQIVHLLKNLKVECPFDYSTNLGAPSNKILD